MKSNHLIITLLLMGWLICHPSATWADIWLVSVGISDYPGESKDLTLPEKDAETIAALYTLNSAAHVILIKNEEATMENITLKMKRLYAQAKEDDIIVLFFSGHGTEGYFLAYDGYLPYDKIRKSMAKSTAKNKMIFVDACRSGDIREPKRASKPSKYNVMLFLSSRSTESSFESPSSMSNGFFTSCLQRALRGGADINDDRTITARELYDAVSKNVKALSNDKQHPVMWGNFDDNMPVIKW